MPRGRGDRRCRSAVSRPFLGCHKIIGAQDNPEIRKIQQYWERREPIPWVRVFAIPEFTYFTHKPHVQAGLACQGCHGPIQQMRVVGASTGPSLANDLLTLVGLRPASRPLTMGWCVDCHREQNATKGRRAPLVCGLSPLMSWERTGSLRSGSKEARGPASNAMPPCGPPCRPCSARNWR
jgi:hypothetical protein